MRHTDLHAADSPCPTLRHGTMGRWPALDGVRGPGHPVLVMVERIHLAPFHGAGLGVDLFFMLSGFLISGPLLAGFQRSGGLDIRRFYWHFPVFALAQRQLGRSLRSLLVELPVTLLLAYGSYRLVERPFLRARERLPRTQQEPAIRGELAVLASAGEGP